MMRPALWRTWLIAVVLFVVASVCAGCTTSVAEQATSASPSVTTSASAGVTLGSTTAPATGSDLAPAEATSDLPTVRVSQLPPQAVDTLELIDQGGPYPYDRDGVTFQNRERILPGQPQGFYSEYTVITPGSKDRGARRIVAGEDGSRFYTDDHYDSFREVVSG